MSDDRQHIIQRYFQEALVGNNPAVVDELLAPTFVNHHPLPGVAADREGIKQLMSALHTAFRDFRIDIQEISIEGENIVVRSLIGGTLQKAFLGMEPTGQAVMLPVTDTFRVSVGRIVERWG